MNSFQVIMEPESRRSTQIIGVCNQWRGVDKSGNLVWNLRLRTQAIGLDEQGRHASESGEVTEGVGASGMPVMGDGVRPLLRCLTHANAGKDQYQQQGKMFYLPEKPVLSDVSRTR